jgi:hypothetical protein
VEERAWSDGMMEYWSDGYGPNSAAVGCRTGQPPVALLDGLDGNHIGRAGLMQRQTRGDRDEIAGLYHA